MIFKIIISRNISGPLKYSITESSKKKISGKNSKHRNFSKNQSKTVDDKPWWCGDDN